MGKEFARHVQADVKYYRGGRKAVEIDERSAESCAINLRSKENLNSDLPTLNLEDAGLLATQLTTYQYQ